MKQRTDLAMEARDLYRESAGGEAEGVRAEERERLGCTVTDVRITDERGAAALGRPVGTYVTIDLSALHRREERAFPRAAETVAEELRSLLPPMAPGSCVLVAGLGNRAVTPDAVGPLAVDRTLVTRHLVEQVPEHFGQFRPVAAMAPGVLGSTGVESGELVAAAVEKLSPACVIAVDALCARAVERLCCTVQLSDAGISPGSGVGNHRAALDRESLGVPVVALGVPTVIGAGTLAADLLAGQEDREPETLRGRGEDLFVTTRDIDARVADLAKVIGFGVSLALQEGLTLEDLELFLS